MEQYLFNNIKNKSEIKYIFDRALEFSYHSWCDELDCSKSWRRQSTDKTYNEIFQIETTQWYATCIKRNSIFDISYYEFCYNTMTDPDYFIWICVNLEDIKYVMGETF